MPGSLDLYLQRQRHDDHPPPQQLRAPQQGLSLPALPLQELPLQERSLLKLPMRGWNAKSGNLGTDLPAGSRSGTVLEV
ncbi:hypothetical protein GCM10009530_62100 [Microbispora corallina]|uniref:Uncharacterized protein n=1 Tax=Microbispora corallina TaxID=83302 RepID=A0ABQ4G7Z5_9ACTN|nr:hypothetical protein Mco01_61490 [Microbispora corallina]